MAKLDTNPEAQEGSSRSVLKIGSALLLATAIFAHRFRDSVDVPEAAAVQSDAGNESLPKEVEVIMRDAVRMYHEIDSHFKKRDISFIEFQNLCTEYKMQAALYRTDNQVLDYPIAIRHIDALIYLIDEKEAIINHILHTPPKDKRIFNEMI